MQMAENALRTAKIEADSCLQPKTGSQLAQASQPVMVKLVAKAPALPAAPVSKETYVLLTDALLNLTVPVRKT